jgi:hypothetical protein
LIHRGLTPFAKEARLERKWLLTAEEFEAKKTEVLARM